MLLIQKAMTYTVCAICEPKKYVCRRPSHFHMVSVPTQPRQMRQCWNCHNRDVFNGNQLYFFSLRGSNVASMNFIHQIRKITWPHVMEDKRQFTQHVHPWTRTQHKVALIITPERQTHKQPMSASAKEFRGYEKSPSCSRPKERRKNIGSWQCGSEGIITEAFLGGTIITKTFNTDDFQTDWSHARFL